MASNFFAMISRLKYIDRWALMRNTHEENLSEHCMETACIAHALAVIGNRRFGKYYNAERAALLGLYHDAPETLTGDMPTPVKYYSPHIREAYAQVEQSACEHLVSMLPEDLRVTAHDQRATEGVGLAVATWSRQRRSVLRDTYALAHRHRFAGQQ